MNDGRVRERVEHGDFPEAMWLATRSFVEPKKMPRLIGGS